MLSDAPAHATIPVSNLDRARRFYGETLGIQAAMDTEGGVMYGAGSTQFFVYPSRHRASGHTQMSWLVNDIKAEVADLRRRGVELEVFDVPGVETLDGISHVGPAVWTAYFKDPDGNLLGLTQIGAVPAGGNLR